MTPVPAYAPVAGPAICSADDCESVNGRFRRLWPAEIVTGVPLKTRMVPPAGNPETEAAPLLRDTLPPVSAISDAVSVAGTAREILSSESIAVMASCIALHPPQPKLGLPDGPGPR